MSFSFCDGEMGERTAGRARAAAGFHPPDASCHPHGGLGVRVQAFAFARHARHHVRVLRNERAPTLHVLVLLCFKSERGELAQGVPNSACALENPVTLRLFSSQGRVRVFGDVFVNGRSRESVERSCVARRLVSASWEGARWTCAVNESFLKNESNDQPTATCIFSFIDTCPASLLSTAAAQTEQCASGGMRDG